MTSLGFENYAEALKIYLSKYREVSYATQNMRPPASTYDLCSLGPRFTRLMQNFSNNRLEETTKIDLVAPVLDQLRELLLQMQLQQRSRVEQRVPTMFSPVNRSKLNTTAVLMFMVPLITVLLEEKVIRFHFGFKLTISNDQGPSRDEMNLLEITF